MDSRIKLKEVKQFISAMKDDYKSSEPIIKNKKKKAILKTISLPSTKYGREYQPHSYTQYGIYLEKK